MVHVATATSPLPHAAPLCCQVTELAPLALLPPPVLRHKVLRPMATMAGGSMLGAALAMERGWAINLGGGMHHACYNDVRACCLQLNHWGAKWRPASRCMEAVAPACSESAGAAPPEHPGGQPSRGVPCPAAPWVQGGGWCPYSDITLALRRLRAASGGAARRVMLVDLDVHQVGAAGAGRRGTPPVVRCGANACELPGAPVVAGCTWVLGADGRPRHGLRARVWTLLLCAGVTSAAACPRVRGLQGNGVARDKLHAGDSDLYIVDAYNRTAYPWDTRAQQASQAGAGQRAGGVQQLRGGHGSVLISLGAAWQREKLPVCAPWATALARCLLSLRLPANGPAQHACVPAGVAGLQAVEQRVELEPGARDEEYLAGVKGALGRAFADFSPDLLIYNAGTDILDGGCLSGGGAHTPCWWAF